MFNAEFSDAPIVHAGNRATLVSLPDKILACDRAAAPAVLIEVPVEVHAKSAARVT
jgi:hypothetical protein